MRVPPFPIVDQCDAFSKTAPETHERAQNAPADCKTDYPLLIAEWPRNAREVIRVALDQYQGRHTVNVRVWWHDGDVLKPGKSGITLSLKHLPAMADALGKALERAIELGLVEVGGEP